MKGSSLLGIIAAGSVVATFALSSTGAAAATKKLSSSDAAYLKADLKAPAGTLNAAGSTFVQPFFAKAFFQYNTKNAGLQVNYQSVGSGAGIKSFQAGTVNFAASDVPMSSSDLAKMPATAGTVIQVPDTLGGVTVSYNLPDVTKRLKLDPLTLAGIFSGAIKTWNDPQITADNPGVTLPSNAIVPEVRADASGTTYIFSNYLTAAAGTSWALGTSKTIAWPASAVQSPGNSGVAASVKSTPYSIGYVELAYALQNKFTYASIRNLNGVYVVPSLKSVAADAAQKSTALTPIDFSVVNEPGKQSYPISGYSWAILLQKQTDATAGAQTVKILDWVTHTGGGQNQATTLGYVVLPPAVQTEVRTELLTVTGPSGSALLTKK
jgi:phosphate transport system substrate-binding protein